MPIRPLNASTVKMLNERYHGVIDDGSDKKEHGGFKVSFFGIVPETPEERARIEKIAHQQLYQEMMGSAARDSLTPLEMRKEMEEYAGGPLNIKLVAVSIGKHDRPGSLANHLEDIEKFIEGSRDLLLKDAIQELTKLGGVRSRQSEASSQDKSALCYALLKVQTSDVDRSTKFFKEHQQTFEALKDQPNLREGFRSAERRLLRDMNRSHDYASNETTRGIGPRYDRQNGYGRP